MLVSRNPSTRDGVALMLAALRQDTEALALLSEDMDLARARDVAMFCALLAADQFQERELERATPGHYTTVLQALAVQLAATQDGTTTAP
ncbi:hypothetical protein [Aquipuribacter hungaricus]|uniref:hypothetical protein n=1 Tax=Aquipuribacter hungaricus TaxID=545624 RepID=UPI0030EF3A35